MISDWIALAVLISLQQPQSPPTTTPQPSKPVVTEAVIVQGRVGAALPLEPTLPGSFTLLGVEELRLSHPPTVNEVLRRIPGVSVRDEEGLGLRPNIGVRGLNPTRSTKVLLLEDGLPLTYAPYGDNASYYHPPVQRFESVEVLKGSGQIAYGPSTVGAVINYLTPLPSTSPSGNAWLAVGNRAFLDANGSFGSTSGRLGYFVDGQARKGDGSRDAIHSDVIDGSAKVTFVPSDGQMFVIRGSHYRERSRNTYSGLTESEYRANPRQNPFVNDAFAADRSGVSLSHHVGIGSRVTLTTAGYLSRFARDWWRQSSNSAQRPNDASDPACSGMENLNTTCGNEGRIRRYVVGGVDARAKLAFRGPLSVDLGVRVHAEAQDRVQKNGDTPTARDGRLVEDNERDVLAVSTYVQPRLAVGRVSITPGVRIENVHFERRNGLASARGRASFTQVIPGVGLAASVGRNALIFGGLHRGFAPPRVEDAISNSGTATELESELSWNAEAGFRAQLGTAIRVDATFFRMDYENQIVPASLAGGVGATLTNGGQTLHQGLELGLRTEVRSPLRNVDRLYARISYTFLPIADFRGARFSSVAGFSGVNVTGNRLPYAPEHLGSVTAGYRSGLRGDIFVEAVRVSSQFGDDLNTVAGTADGQRGIIEAALTWNAGANLNLAGNRATIYVAAYNLADTLYVVDRSRGILPSPQRRVQAGLRLKF